MLRAIGGRLYEHMDNRWYRRWWNCPVLRGAKQIRDVPALYEVEVQGTRWAENQG